ncbi:MAG: formylmethanofuran dehydrogenase [Candidatus Bathyarchaeota archaeon]|nr:formylmethanofuran dehydrogenase [Candidatus Bathyarchaeota archaeon]MCX8162361.1 formylmethanofuran dehydrogenase [Candidatus Bathyarchaeota archaeon]
MSCSGRLKIVLITGRSIKQGRSKDTGKFFDEYREAISVCEMNPMDMEALGIARGGYIDISSPYGSVTVLATPSPDIPRGVAFIPYGMIANMLIPPDTEGTGMPRSKGLEVWVTPSVRRPQDLRSLVKSVGGV